MKILFYFPDESAVRVTDLSYTSLLSGGGFSGTETALLELSKYLVDSGHVVTIFGVNKTYTDNGISFISKNDIDLVDRDVDWYSPLYFINDGLQRYLLSKLDLKKTRVFIWFHCFLDNNDVDNINKHEIYNTKRPIKLYGQYVSKYIADEYQNIIPPTKSWIIFNGLNRSLFENKQIFVGDKRGRWIFHPTFQRGGLVAVNIFKRVRALLPEAAKTMQIMSYYKDDSLRNNFGDSIVNLGSVSKKEIGDILCKTDYFVYPLILSNGSVHHDTFATAILEALATGVIVVVWDVACISSVYSDKVVKISVPDKIRRTYNPQARFARCPWMLSDEARDLFVDRILELESNPQLKEEIRQKGISWAKDITWDRLGAQMEENLEINRYT